MKTYIIYMEIYTHWQYISIMYYAMHYIIYLLEDIYVLYNIVFIIQIKYIQYTVLFCSSFSMEVADEESWGTAARPGIDAWWGGGGTSTWSDLAPTKHRLYRVSPCSTVFHCVSPCFTMFYYVSLCLYVYIYIYTHVNVYINIYICIACLNIIL